jgi:hypothetical protein
VSKRAVFTSTAYILLLLFRSVYEENTVRRRATLLVLHRDCLARLDEGERVGKEEERAGEGAEGEPGAGQKFARVLNPSLGRVAGGRACRRAKLTDNVEVVW